MWQRLISLFLGSEETTLGPGCCHQLGFPCTAGLCLPHVPVKATLLASKETTILRAVYYLFCRNSTMDTQGLVCYTVELPTFSNANIGMFNKDVLRIGKAMVKVTK